MQHFCRFILTAYAKPVSFFIMQLTASIEAFSPNGYCLLAKIRSDRRRRIWHLFRKKNCGRKSKFFLLDLSPFLQTEVKQHILCGCLQLFSISNRFNISLTNEKIEELDTSLATHYDGNQFLRIK